MKKKACSSMKFSYPLAVILLSAITVPSYGQDETQYGDIVCSWDDDTGVLTANLLVYKNGTDIVGAYLGNYDNSGNKFYEATDDDCLVTGSGSDDEPFTVTVQYNFKEDTAVSGVSDCDATVIKANEEYYWMMHTYRALPYMQKGDLMLKYICNISHRLPDELMVQGEIQVYDLETYISAGGGLLKLTAVNDKTEQRVLNQISIGDYFHLELSFQPDGISRPGTDDRLSAWGAYCNKLYAEPPDGSVRSYMLDSNTCPRTDFDFLQLGGEFTATQPDGNNKFKAYTGPIQAGRFDKAGSNVVSFFCEATLCWINDDEHCYNSCNKLSGRRKRTEELYMVSVSLYVTDDPDKLEKESVDTEDSGVVALHIWVIIGVGAALALAVVIVGTVCVIRRMRRERYGHQHDSYTSSNSVYSRKPNYMYRY